MLNRGEKNKDMTKQVIKHADYVSLLSCTAAEKNDIV